MYLISTYNLRHTTVSGQIHLYIKIKQGTKILLYCLFNNSTIFPSSVVTLVLIPVATSLVPSLVLLVTRFLICGQTGKRNYQPESVLL